MVGHAVASVVATSPSCNGSRSTRRTAAWAGRQLLEAVVATARAGGADRMLLEVREDNAGAIAFYAARGFIEIDRRARYYRDGTTAVVMRPRLVERLRRWPK